MKRGSRTASLGIAVVASAIAFVAIPAGAAFATPPVGNGVGTATLNGGDLLFTVPEVADFGSTDLTGADTTAGASQAIDVKDGTGTGDGWLVSLTTTTFTDALSSATLPTDALTDFGPGDSATCDEQSPGCAPAENEVSYAVDIPAGTDAPAPVLIENARPGTGMGDQTSTHQMVLAIPAAATAGTYTSDWTYTLSADIV
jgi:hypothetical protein